MRSPARALHLIHRALAWSAALGGRALEAVRRLPPRVALFYVAALALAIARRDRFTLASATRPDDLGTLLELEETVATFEAWRPQLANGAIVVFHDYGNPQYPGAQEAVKQLGLDGQAAGGVFVWRAD